MYDFGLTCDIESPEPDAARLWSGAAAPAIAFFRERIGAERIPFFRPSAAGCWDEARGPLHRHRSEIFFQVQGCCEFTFPAETVTLRPGDILLVPLGMPHVERASALGGKPFFNLVLTVAEGFTTLHIGIVRAGSRRSGRPEILVRRSLPDPVFYRGAVMALSRFSSRPHGADDAGAALLEALLRQLAADLRGGALPEHIDAACRLSMRAKSRLDGACGAPAAEVGALAAELGCSASYLSHSFRASFGIPLNHYIRDLRLDYARTLLSGNLCNVSEAAERCGFRDASYFSRLFKRRFGVNPGKMN